MCMICINIYAAFAYLSVINIVTYLFRAYAHKQK